MKKRWAILSLTIIVLTLCIFTQSTFAWFTDIASYQKTFQIGDISYTYSGTLINGQSSEIVVPGQPLITGTSLYLTNKSSIDTNLRLQIRFSYTDQITHLPVEETYSGDINNHLTNFMVMDMVSNWIYDATDHCWHYKYSTDYKIPAATTAEGDTFVIINQIQFDGEKVDMSLSGAIFKIQLIFQAKQSELLDWVTLGTTDIDLLAAS